MVPFTTLRTEHELLGEKKQTNKNQQLFKLMQNIFDFCHNDFPLHNDFALTIAI